MDAHWLLIQPSSVPVCGQDPGVLQVSSEGNEGLKRGARVDQDLPLDRLHFTYTRNTAATFWIVVRQFFIFAYLFLPLGVYMVSFGPV